LQLALTQAGVELLAQVPLFDRTSPFGRSLAGLGDDQARQLLRLLRELVKGMAPDIALI
jgi:hypothetical protein